MDLDHALESFLKLLIRGITRLRLRYRDWGRLLVRERLLVTVLGVIAHNGIITEAYLGVKSTDPLGIARGTSYVTALLPCRVDPPIPIPPMRRRR
jgi:hypothetical protein